MPCLQNPLHPFVSLYPAFRYGPDSYVSRVDKGTDVLWDRPRRFSQFMLKCEWLKRFPFSLPFPSFLLIKLKSNPVNLIFCQFYTYPLSFGYFELLTFPYYKLLIFFIFMKLHWSTILGKAQKTDKKSCFCESKEWLHHSPQLSSLSHG